jgi:peptidoglycan-associated lipoprotein
MRLPTGLIVAGGLVLALTGCATHATQGTGAADAAGTGASGAGAGGLAAGGAGAGGAGGSGSDGAAVGAPGATLFPTLPSPKEFTEVAGLRDVHFDFDRVALRAEDARILDANARWLLENAGTQVLIEGHADERGTNEYNMVLGERRAKAAVTYLVSRGVDARRFVVVSWGEDKPYCMQAGEKCWAKNRRAHFLFKAE